ncbi:diguanylate cyclase domain-containing protein [Kutzneria sp. CA-103260]|uniref:diguanylate cyclase domain-containing protein n=1 Tax=Kutzneria sp. CA-103260 TaxID=2802641 RepID=UPI001BAC5F83|nr:diguanylate cyclase [Kutzneria sp. CA-103260]QUQ68142.1 Diguanylate cyclase, GGDEF domain [Kutzneria sp. CA-103260]
MAGSDGTQPDAEVGTLSVPAWQLRWRAPELSLVLSERASALATGRRDEQERLRAETLTVFALNRLDKGVQAVERAVTALKAAEAGNHVELAWGLRVELAACARAAGVPLTGFGVLKPVLRAEGVPTEIRASALVALTDCLVLIGRSKELTDALDQADHLYGEDATLDADAKLLSRALLRVSTARQFRRWGDLKAAVGAARDGLALLGELSDAAADSGYVASRLVLELVCALMDSEQLADAVTAAEQLLEQPVRAPSAASVGWLKLALATRVHLPAGRTNIANDLLLDVADSAGRHQLDPLLSESMLALSHVHEMAGQLAEALSCLRSAHTAERRRTAALYTVRAKLAEEFAAAHRESTGLKEQLSSLIKPPVASSQSLPDTDAVTGLLNRNGFRRRIDAVVNGGYIDHALSLVLLDVDVARVNGSGVSAVDDQVIRKIADRVRDTAPDKAAVGRTAGDELAVLLPHTTHDQAQRWAEELRSEVSPRLAVTMTTGVAEYRPGSGGEALLTDADQALSQARSTNGANEGVDLGTRGTVPAVETSVERVDPAPQSTPPSGELPRRRARRADEQAAGLSTAWAQAADRWRMGNTGTPSTPVDVTKSADMFSDGNPAPERERTQAPGALAAFFRAAADSTATNAEQSRTESTGGRRRAEDRETGVEATAQSRHANDDSNRPGLASLVELLAAAGTGGRRRAPEPSESETPAASESAAPESPVSESTAPGAATPEPAAKPKPDQRTTGRRRRAESFERDEIADELRADSGRWRLEQPSSRVAAEPPAVEPAAVQPAPVQPTLPQSAPATRTDDLAASLGMSGQPPVLGAQAAVLGGDADSGTVPFTTYAGLPREIVRRDGEARRESETAAKPDAVAAPSDTEAAATVADRPADEHVTGAEGRRPRSELADLLAEALVAFESTEHAVHAHFDDEPSVSRPSPEPTPTADRYDWQPEPSGSRHRQPEPDDRIDVPSTLSEPPMLSDWVLSGKEDRPPRADTSGLGDWEPTPFREDRPVVDRDPRPAEPERNWSDWTWTPPER